MTKGISRQIVEITNTGNPFFERALLVVRPSHTDQPAATLRKEAERVLNDQNGYSGLRRAQRRHRIRQLLWLLLGAALALAVETIVNGL